MILIAAENRELALSISINQRNPKPEPEGPGTGYYLALTFGTLLSSQGADAQKLDPRGRRPWLEVQLYAGFQELPRGGSGPAALPGRAAHGEPYTIGRGPCAGVAAVEAATGSNVTTAQLRRPGSSRSPR